MERAPDCAACSVPGSACSGRLSVAITALAGWPRPKYLQSSRCVPFDLECRAIAAIVLRDMVHVFGPAALALQ